MKKQTNLKAILFYVIIVAVVIATSSMLLRNTGRRTPEYSAIVNAFEKGEVREFEIDPNDLLTFVTYDGKEYSYRLQSLNIFYEDLNDTIREQVRTNEEKDVKDLKSGDGVYKYNYEEPTYVPFWVSFLPYIIMGLLFLGLFIYMMRQASGRDGRTMSFGRSRAKLATDDKDKKTFADVAGADEEKEELREIVEFLRDPRRYTKLGAKIPHGVLLVGPPGTGKTLLAKAVAGEAGVPFYSISGSDFVEMYVGVGASRVRDLFETARKSNAAIIFIDEIDAVGRHRGAGLGGGHDEREQTLNQLLVEMDGFGSHDGVIVMAATNRPDILDPALLRPGRFDRQITVNYPDLKGREEILKVHAKGKPFTSDVDFAKIAQTTAGLTGADLANLLNEAALLAARRGNLLIGMDDIEDASIKVMVGPHKKSMRIKDEEKKKTAYHEAGHAILGHLLPGVDPVRQISIIPAGHALGYTLNPPAEDKYSVYRNGLLDEITMMLGGRVAEKIIFDDFSGGASNDIERATAIARKMVTELGMSDRLGPIKYGSGEQEIFLGRDFSSTPNYSDATATAIDEEIHRIISDCYAKAEKLLRENIGKLHFIAGFLTKYEIMDDVQFARAMELDEPTVEEIAALADERKARRDRENAERAKAAEEERARRKKEESEHHHHPHQTGDPFNPFGEKINIRVEPTSPEDKDKDGEEEDS
ncbi:MAG: ATP-dependent zinc metalloprotease FtsH [Clostridia bacterium]|nr:ATP-dependent zinc metalloprotease FtsH [Clostridia bacterium]